MSSQRSMMLMCFYLLVSLLVSTSSLPVTEQEEDIPTTTEIPRDTNPVYNVWEYAYVHDGPINTRAAAAHEPQREESRGNQCLWAIVSCCSAHTNYERDNCFDALGCPGAWFQNLCSDEYISVANSQVSSIFASSFGKK